MEIKEAIARLVDGADLTQVEAEEVMRQIVRGEATPSQIAALAVGLRMKGESPAEIAGLARIMREHAKRLDVGEVLDVVGTGGDGNQTFNISTLSALVAVAAGAKVAKHGNRGITSGCGSADLLEALNIAIDLEPEGAAQCVRQTGFGFMFAPLYHPAMGHAALPRREIGVRTVFNILGPLTNPAGSTMQLTGVARPELAQTVAEVHRLMGMKRAMVVHGGDGIDELSLSAPSRVHELVDGRIRTYELRPEEVGLKSAPLKAIQGGTVEANLRLAHGVLAGELGPPRDVVLLNTGAALYVAGLEPYIEKGIQRAARAIDSGAARQKVEQVSQVSQELRAAQTGGGAKT